MTDRFKVVAHVMHEEERNAASGTLEDSVPAAAFVTGLASQSQIDDLQKRGLIIEVIGQVDASGRTIRPGEPETPGHIVEFPPASPGDVPRRRPIVFSTRAPTAAFGAEGAIPDVTQPQVYLIQFEGPLLDDYKAKLDALDVTLLENFRSGFYSARLTHEQARQVRSLPFVLQALLYDAAQTGPAPSAGLETLAPPPVQQPGIKRMLTHDIRLHRSEDAAAVQAWLEERHIAVAGASGHKIRIYLLEDSPIIPDLLSLAEIQRVEEFVPPRLWNDRACNIMGLTMSASSLPYDGDGQIIGIADTGLDDAHADFAGRMVAVIARGRPTSSDDPHGHGTHVAGSALGDGTASGGSYKGTAPKAKLVFQSLLDSSGGLGGLPLNLGDLFDEAYVHGARIHNNSWGAATVSTYTMNSEEVDAFVADNRDMLVVFAAGNEGQGANLLNARQGYVDWLSIGSPATAKNALTVGASRSDRTSGGYSTNTYGSLWTTDFPHVPIASENVSGNAEEIAAFSSRGPSDDRRIKPDVVAPGTDILSCKSSRAPIRNFWGSLSGNAAYAYMGGTSMAAPLVAGCAALARQYFVEDRNHEPSAALLRATIINGARWLTGQHAIESNPPGATPEGNFDQGFGCINMAATLPHPNAPNLKLAFVDNWKNPAEQLGSSGDRKRWTVDVAGGGVPLRICLAYTDRPGRALQNNLNLFVQAPDGRKLMGNQQLRFSLKIPDVDNNVEVVRIENPQTGTYWLQITANNLLQSPQDFALVVTGHLAGDQLMPM